MLSYFLVALLLNYASPAFSQSCSLLNPSALFDFSESLHPPPPHLINSFSIIFIHSESNLWGWTAELCVETCAMESQARQIVYYTPSIALTDPLINRLVF